MINDSLEFFKLGFEKVFGISAINGSGTGDLLDELVKILKLKLKKKKRRYHHLQL
tara:strand:+ start:171 stop:335 length:165 start_codon:yes stop_codon:yes gene_type:complete